MTICEKRLKRIAGGEPFFPGEVVAMALELLANSKETLRPEYPETLPARSFLNPASGLAKALALTWFCEHLTTGLNVTLNWMPWVQRPAQSMMPLSLNFGKNWVLVPKQKQLCR
ncbi:hypothetical protein OVX87_16170 [Klebsiella pneumoniae]|nr:hypothetical protein [Klebsiella pneumoniae]